MFKKIIVYSIFIFSFCVNNIYANKLIESMKFISGVFTSYAIHEGAHFVIANALNEDFEFETNTSYNQTIGFKTTARNNTNGILIHSSGITSHLISSHIILNSDFDKNNKYIWGIMFWNVINPIYYCLDYNFFQRGNFINDKEEYYGDIKNIERYSGKTEANIFAIGTATIALYQGYKFVKDLKEDNYKEGNFKFNMIGGYKTIGIKISKSF